MGWRIALACRQPRPEPASLLQTSTSGRAFTAVEPQRYPAIRTQAAEVSQDEVPESTDCSKGTTTIKSSTSSSGLFSLFTAYGIRDTTDGTSSTIAFAE